MKCLISLLLILACGLCFSQNLTQEVFLGFEATANQTGQNFYIQISKVVIDKPTNAVYCHFDAYNSKDDYESGKDKISTRAFEIPVTADLQAFIDMIFQVAYKQTIDNKESISGFTIGNVNSITVGVSE
jgi:hypothetical protein